MGVGGKIYAEEWQVGEGEKNVSLGLHGVGGGSSKVVRDGGGTSGEGEVWVSDVVV